MIDSQHDLIQGQLDKIVVCDEWDIVNEYMILIRMMEWHFMQEEELMRSMGYPDYAKHKKIHSDLIIRTSFILDYNPADINKEFIKKYVNIWFRKAYYFHSKHMDIKLGQFIRSISAVSEISPKR